jgi:hypothetical protein
LAVITEGEFKAAALWQVLGSSAVVGSLPGITMARQLLADIEEWLDGCGGLRQVVVAYDNEEKGDPALPAYKEEPWKRYDAQIWARYLARQLTKEGMTAKCACCRTSGGTRTGKRIGTERSRTGCT